MLGTEKIGTEALYSVSQQTTSPGPSVKERFLQSWPCGLLPGCCCILFESQRKAGRQSSKQINQQYPLLPTECRALQPEIHPSVIVEPDQLVGILPCPEPNGHPGVDAFCCESECDHSPASGFPPLSLLDFNLFLPLSFWFLVQGAVMQGLEIREDSSNRTCRKVPARY